MSAARVAVLGGGWAGLAAAVTLAERGIAPTVFESARQLGGRARRVRFGALRVDNGQHLLIGAYRTTLELLATVGADPKRALQRLPLRLPMRYADGREVLLRTRALPAPLHLAAGLLGARGLRWGERLRALRFAVQVARLDFRLPQDITAAELFRRFGQQGRPSEALWRPLCLAALNTPAEHASAQVFLNVLRDAFGQRREDSDLIFPATDLGTLLPEPAMEYIEAHGGRIRLGSRVMGIEAGPTGVQAVVLEHERQEFDQVIVALSPWAAARLLAPHAPLKALAADIERLQHQPICTVYLNYGDPGVRLPEPILGLVDMSAHWLFDRRLAGAPGLLAAVISGPGPHLELDNRALGARVAAELAALFPAWPAPAETLVIREKRATFSCEVPSERHRPTTATPLPGCWLAGDYTATGYPGTLEGAARSGVQCARAVLEQLSPESPARS